MTGRPPEALLRQLSPERGWRREMLRDEHGPYAIVAVRVGPTWTDAVAIEGADRTVAMRHPTRDDHRLPGEFTTQWRREGPGLVLSFAGESTATWRRQGRCAEVLTELLGLPRD